MDSSSKSKKQIVSSKETATICNVIVVGVDGSEGSHNAVELVVKDFHRRGLDKIILVHISNAQKEHEKGVQYHSKTIYNTYSEYLKEQLQEADYEIIFEDRKENENVFEQVNEIAVAKNASLMVVGFRGYKGAKNRSDELSKSVTYLVHKPKIPVLVVKEKTAREIRLSGAFKWLVCLESADTKAFKALLSTLRYVDAESDILHGFTVGEDQGEKIKKEFEAVMTKYEIKNFDFTVVPREDNSTPIKNVITAWIEEHLKDETHFIDFAVLGYNPIKYNFNKEVANTTVDIIKSLNVNIFFDH
jgi:nucleotide-binding universal stress UspA family protein